MNMQKFIEEVEGFKDQLSTEAQTFLEALKNKKTSSSVLTENGKKILDAMADNAEKYSNTFSSKQLGELLFMSSRSVSGSMRKLLTEEYVNKKGANPVSYEITQKGIDMVKDSSIDK